MEHPKHFIESSLAKEIKERSNQSYEQNAFLPVNRGEWEGEKGESTWKPESDYIPQKKNPDGKTWGDILAEYEINGIKFKDGYPIFDDIAVAQVEIDDFTENRADNFAQADQALADKWTEEGKDGKTWSAEDVRNYREEHNLTWHEKEDMKTMQLVPCEVHNNVSHEGGIAVKKREIQTG